MTQPRPAWEIYSSKRRAGFVAILFLVSMSNYVDRQILSVLLEPIKSEFGVSDTALGLLTGLSFALFYATLGLPIARLADRSDRKVIITAALVVWSAMTMACGQAATFTQLVLARIGVGAGEAGAIPPAQSLLADYYPPERRTRALAAFTLASTAGFLIGLAGGGWVAQHYGWRTAFVVAGAPGLVIAVIVHLFLQEPRNASGGLRTSGAPEHLRVTVAALATKPAYVLIVSSMVLYFLMAYGALVFVPSFMVRVHHLTIAEAGLRFAVASGAGAVLGTLGGGWLSDRLAARNIAWLARLPGWGLLLAWPVHVAAFLAPSLSMSLVMLFTGALLLSAVVPSQYSALHAVCGSPRRATAVAVAFLFTNLIGLGLGPVIAGAMSDAFAASFGPAEGLRFSLAAIVVMFLPAGVLMLYAARRLAADAEA